MTRAATLGDRSRQARGAFCDPHGASLLALREALRQSWRVNALDDRGTWGDPTNGFIAPATEKICDVKQSYDKCIANAPLTQLSLDDLIDWAIEQGYFDDKFPRWETEHTLFEEETEEWADDVAYAEKEGLTST